MTAPSSWLMIALACTLSAQDPAQKRFVNQAEFNLLQRAVSERDSGQRIAALMEWGIAFPNSDFQRDRSLMLANAYKGASQPVKSFALARELLKSDPRDLPTLYLTVTVALSLEAPSQEEVRIAEQAARGVLSLASEQEQLATTQKSVVTDTALDRASDSESEPVVELLREWRRGKPRPPMWSEVKSAAESALAWARSYSK